MKSILLSLSLFLFTGINGQNINPYSHFRLDKFYDIFLEEEAELLDEHGRFTGKYNPKEPLNPPGPDIYYGDYLPIVFDNRTTMHDHQVYVVVTGQMYDDANTGVVLQFDPATGKGSIYTFANSTGNASDYAIALSSLPTQQDGVKVLHVPQIQSARVWISIDQKLSMALTPPQSIVEPNFKSPSDSNYNTLYDFFEFNFQQSASPPIYVNATAVDFFSMPIRLSLKDATSANTTNGIAQSQSSVFTTVKKAFSKAITDQANWNQTILSNGQYNNLRIISPGKAAAGNPVLFDTAFYQNGAFNYLADIWTGTDGNGAGAYYKINPLSITLKDVGRIYTGNVNGSGEIVLTCPGGGEITFYNPTSHVYPNTYSASVNILTQTNFLAAYTGSAFPDDYLEVQNLFTQGILAGLVPTTGSLGVDYFQNNRGSYFTVNPNLTSPGPTTGPWYSIYSQALLTCGPIYTMSVSEDLFPDVQISGPYIENQTYIGVTLGSLN